MSRLWSQHIGRCTGVHPLWATTGAGGGYASTARRNYAACRFQQSTRAGAGQTSLSGSRTDINGNLTDIKGGVILLNDGGSCQSAARLGDPIVGVAVGNPGVVNGNVAGGSSNVCIGG